MSDLKINLQEILQEKQDKIIPENIKKDVQIFDVIGTYEGSDITLQEKSVDIIDNGATEVVPDSNYYGLSKVNINTNVVNKPNIFMQETEPETKEGIWVKANKQVDKIESIENLITGEGEWIDTYSNLPHNIYQSSCAVSIENDIYIFGGYGSENYKKAYKYNTLNNTYTQLTDIPYSFQTGCVATVGTDIYLFGGYNNFNTAYKYDTITDTYTQLANIPYGYYGAGISAVGTDIYLFGTSYKIADKKKVYKYDTLTNTYTQLTNMSFISEYSSIKCLSINTDIYIFFAGGNTENILYKYDTLAKIYTPLSNSPIPVYTASGICVNNSNIYLFSGGGSDTKNLAYKYDTITDTYTQLANIPYGFLDGNVVSVLNKIYLLGGDSHMTMIQVYELPILSFDDKTIILIQGTGQYKTQLYENEDIDGRLLYSFDDVKYNTTEDGLDDTLPTYYGTGTEWVKFKN